MEAVSKIYLKLRYYFKLWRLNLDLKSVSEDACLRSKGKSFHKNMSFCHDLFQGKYPT